MQNRTGAVPVAVLAFDLEKKVEAYLKSHEWHRLIHPQLGDDFLVALWSEGNVIGGLGKDGFVEIERNKIPGKKNIVRAVATKKAVENCLNESIRVRILETHGLVEVIQNWALLSIPDAVKAKVINHRTSEVNNKAKRVAQKVAVDETTGSHALPSREMKKPARAIFGHFDEQRPSAGLGHVSMEIKGQSA